MGAIAHASLLTIPIILMRVAAESRFPNNVIYGFTADCKIVFPIPQINEALRQVAENEKVTYIDLFSHFADEQGQMKAAYTNDGLHLLGSGYLLWKEILTPYITSIMQNYEN